MTEIWAHRGAVEFAPENTLPAFRKAIELGAQGIELDVQRTRDGHLVILHDETVERTSNGTGAVVDLTLDELRRFDFSSRYAGYEGSPIPTLREVLELLAPTDLRLNIELKDTLEPYQGMPLEAKALVDEYGMAQRVVYSSFNHYGLATLRDVVEPENLGLLYLGGLFEPWRYAQWFGAGALHPGRLALRDEELIANCHDAGIAIHVWTVNDEATVAHLAAQGIDAIITDYPDRALAALEGKR